MSQIAEIIKYEGDNSTFIWKHPSEDFNSLTQLSSDDYVYIICGLDEWSIHFCSANNAVRPALWINIE